MNQPFLDYWRQQLGATVAALDGDGGEPISGREAPAVPPAEVIRRVNSAEKADPRVFLRSGVGDLLAIVDTLAEAIAMEGEAVGPGFPVRPAVMELGCGVGRLLRHAPSPERARVVATDVNRESLDWCRTHLRGVDYHHHGPLPPISTLPAASFHIIYAHSVFTHIPLERQRRWLWELERLLTPDGWLAMTVLGHAQQDALLDDNQRARLAAEGAVQIHPEWPAVEGDGGPTAYGAVCQTIAHQEATIGAVFDIRLRRTRRGKQDVLAVRRRRP